MVILYAMKRPIFVRPLSDAERESLEAGLRSPSRPSLCVVARSCSQAIVARTPTKSPPTSVVIRRTVRNAIHKFNAEGLSEALRRGSNRPHTVHRAFDPEGT